MEYPGVRFLSSLRAPSSSDLVDQAQESVDLLQMVPETTSRVPPPHRTYAPAEDTLNRTTAAPPTGHETPPRRMRVLLVQDDDHSSREDVTESLRGGGNIGVGGGGGGSVGMGLDSVDSGLGGHVCQNCSRDGGIYYNRQGELAHHYECRNNHDTTRDGSVYFNYLQFANRSRTQTLPGHSLLTNSSAYEPIDRGGSSGGGGGSLDRVHNNKKAKAPKPPKPPKPANKQTSSSSSASAARNNKTTSRQSSIASCRNFVFNCCKSNNNRNSSSNAGPRRQNSINAATAASLNSNKGKQGKSIEDINLYGSSIYQHQHSHGSGGGTGASGGGASSAPNTGGTPSSSPAILNNNRARKRNEWSRVKRLLFLVGILLGILVALGGIVVGFVVLAPHRSGKDKPCAHHTPIHCAGLGCVSVGDICQKKISCSNIPRSSVCYHNGSGDSQTSNADNPKAEIVDVVTLEPNFEKPVKGDSGWVYFSQGNGQGGGSRYIIINRAMLFSRAQEECRDLGGHLVHVNSIREQVFLEDFVSQELEDFEIRKDAVGFWLGARRQRGSHSGKCLLDQWKWVDVYNREHGAIKGFAAFIPGKPDNLYSPEECLFMSYKETEPDSFLKWDDAPCDIQSVGRFKVLCEIDDKS